MYLPLSSHHPRKLFDAQEKKSKRLVERINPDFDNLRNECSEYPTDNFNYSQCEVPDPCFLGNSICNIESYFSSDFSEIYYTPECNYDGGDCDWLNSCKYPEDDEFDYTYCNATVKCVIKDDNCNEIYNTPSCNFDGGDCEYIHLNGTELEGYSIDENCSSFPEDNFGYEYCDVEFPCLIGNGFCNMEPFLRSNQTYYTQECNFDGGDCEFLGDCEYPQDFFNYSDCNASIPCYVGNDECDPSYNISRCNFDGGDCLNKIIYEGSITVVEFDYGDCEVVDLMKVGNGICDIQSDFLSQEIYYTPQCNFDGGDCDWFVSTCNYINDGFDYRDCDSSMPCKIGNGICDIVYNVSSCNEDGGDCNYHHMPGINTWSPSVSPSFSSIIRASLSPSFVNTSRPSISYSIAPSEFEVREEQSEREDIYAAIFNLFQTIADIIDYFLDEYIDSK